MTNLSPNREAGLPGISFYAFFLLIFLQLLSDLIETTYVFGLLGVSIPPEVVSVLFLLAPLLLILLPGALERRSFAAVTGGLALVCRGLSLTMDTRGRMLAAGLGTGMMLLFLAALLWQLRGRRTAVQASIGLGFASLLLVLLRAGYHGNDLSNFTGEYRTGFWLILAAGLYLIQWWRSVPVGDAAPASNPAADLKPEETAGRAVQPPSFSQAAWMGVGLFSAPLLLYYGLSAPAVIARWTGIDYYAITLMLAGSAAVWAALWALLPGLRGLLTTPRALEIWNGLFLLGLVFLLRSFTVYFPPDPGAYPLAAPDPGPLAWVTLVMLLVLHPVIFVDFGLMVQKLLDRMSAPGTQPRSMAVSVWAGGLWLMLMSFAHVFTTVYDYIPEIGPLFRDQFWMVYLAAGLGAALPLLLIRPAPRKSTADEIARPGLLPFYALGLFALIAVSTFGLQARPEAAPQNAETLRVLTFNIQQGYTAAGEKGFDEQLALIRSLEPDIIGLQESDTARIAGGNADVVRYFADQLHYHSYYGPSTVTGTFGIALLSRYPIQQPETLFLYSEGEQTATIKARISAGGQDFTVLVTHLGNGGPLIQQEQVLAALEGAENVIAMGDFNFRPDSEQYALTTARYEDAWERAVTQEISPPDLNAARKIDHVFVSPGMRVLRGIFLGPGPSDHPALFVEIELDAPDTASIVSTQSNPQEDSMLDHFLFDDFAYADKDAMRASGWILRDAPGWPGVAGAVWSADHIQLIDDDQRAGGRLVELRAATEGVEAGTRQAQMCHCRKYFEGTYASRVRFLDEPISGPGGDQLVTTFYQISPSRHDMDPDYSELDFEYLPNGGWGKTSRTMFTTSWETFQLEPFKAKNNSTAKGGSYEGWHTLVLQVMDGQVRYFIDGELFAEHTGSVYPRVPMAMSYNLWFIRGGLAPATEPREYRQWIDWAFYADKALLSPEEVEREVARLRGEGTAFHDSVDPGDPPLESPCNF